MRKYLYPAVAILLLSLGFMLGNLWQTHVTTQKVTDLESVASKLVQAKYSSRNTNELQKAYDSYQSSMSKSLYQRVFNAKTATTKTAWPTAYNGEPLEYEPFDTFSRAAGVKGQTFVYVLARVAYNIEDESVLEEKIIARFTVKSNKLIDYREL